MRANSRTISGANRTGTYPHTGATLYTTFVDEWDILGHDDRLAGLIDRWQNRADAMGVDMADVIVVGAGLSGLVASRKVMKLQKNASVVVLEARDRVGGRMFAQDAGEAGKGWVDLGGQWIGEDHSNL